MIELPIVSKEKRTPKPSWLKIELPTGENYTRVKRIVKEHKLHTICEDGRCHLIREALNATIVKPIKEVREIMQEGRSSIPVATYYYQDQNGIVHQQWTYQSSQPRYVAGQPLRNVMRAQPVRSLLRGVVQRFRCR